MYVIENDKIKEALNKKIKKEKIKIIQKTINKLTDLDGYDLKILNAMNIKKMTILKKFMHIK